MSLAQHVTATEGVDREPIGQQDEEEASQSTWRRLSFDAFAPVENFYQEQEPKPHIAAYKVSNARRVGKWIGGLVGHVNKWRQRR